MRLAAILLGLAIMAAPAVAAPISGCPISAGYSGQFHGGDVDWFTWDSATSVMMVRLQNGEIHSFSNVPRSIAAAFATQKPTQTGTFYHGQVQPHPENLLFELPSYACSAAYEGPPPAQRWVYAGPIGYLQVGSRGTMVYESGGTPAQRPPVAFIWTKPSGTQKPVYVPYVYIGPMGILGIGATGGMLY